MRMIIGHLLLLALVFSVPALYGDEPVQRPEKWAVPVKSMAVKNLYRLDDKVYRSAQPDRKGFQYLKSLGIVSILNLRDRHSDDAEADGLGLGLFRVEMKAEKIKRDEVIQALRIIRESKGPVLIHCWHGSDRTGAVSAMYRIVFQNWTKEDALEELVKGGYGYHTVYKNIPEFIRTSDVEFMKKKVFTP